MSKYCRIASTPVDALSQASYSNFFPSRISMNYKHIGWGCSRNKGPDCTYKRTTFTNGFPNYGKTSSLKKLKAFSKKKSAAPECIDTGRGTYKDTLNELDKLSPGKRLKALKQIKIPKNIPFEHLDLRKQRKIIKSLSRFEIVKRNQRLKSSISKKTLKPIRDGSYLQIKMTSPMNSPSKSRLSESRNVSHLSNRVKTKNFSPVLNRLSEDSSISEMIEKNKKFKEGDLANFNSSISRVGHKNDHSLSKEETELKKAYKKHAEALTQEGLKAFMKTKYYKNMVSNKVNSKAGPEVFFNISKVYDRTCARCKSETKFKEKIG